MRETEATSDHHGEQAQDVVAETERAEAAARDGDRWLTVLFVLLLVAGLMLLGLGLWVAWTRQEYTVLGLGLLAVIVPSSAYAMAGRAEGRRTGAPAADPGLEAMLEEQLNLLRSINERLLLSDQAKRTAFRQKDREALRQAIEEDIYQEDYDAAMALIEEMANTYGYKEEAEQFRHRLIDVQTRKRESLMERAVQRIDEICARRDWERARQEASQLKRMYPDHPEMAQLPQRVAQAREQHKEELERAFLQAAERDEIERAMDLLKEMDKYLTSEEAAPYMETARGVVGKKRQNLGVRFKMAMQDRDWAQALNVGEQIIREFPNSKMAGEVRGMIDKLRRRATEQRSAVAEQEPLA